MSNVPKARDMLRNVGDALMDGRVTRSAAALAIYAVLPMLTRKSPVRRAPVRKRYVTEKVAREICRYARQNPDAHLDEIARAFDVNPGRVSEVLNGKR